MSIEYGVSVVFVVVCSVFDIRRKEVPVLLVGVFGLLALIAAIIRKSELYPLLYSFIPGAAMLALSLCTRESIGYGDGLIVLVLGVFLGLGQCWAVVLSGLILSAAAGLVLLIFHKVNGKTRIPFIPFLAAGLGVVVFVQLF